MKRIKYAVLLIARNEEKVIIPTLESIVNQSLKPIKIILVNDGSSDGMRDKISHRFPTEISIIDYPYDHESYLNDPRLARVHNLGLNELTVLDIDYLLLMGADQVLPPNYSQTLIDMMEKDHNLAITSGTIQGEFNTLPRGSGRMYRNAFLRLIGYHFIENYAYEDYHLFKAMQLKFKVFVDNSLLTKARTTGANYKSNKNIIRGRSYRALGYSKLYLSLRLLLKENKQTAREILQGYEDKDIKLYEPELRSFVCSWQKKQLFKLSSIKKIKG